MVAEPLSDPTLLIPRPASDIIPLACGCGLCHLPYARIEQGGLWIQSRHNGDNHQNRVPDAIILQLAGMILMRQMLGGS